MERPSRRPILCVNTSEGIGELLCSLSQESTDKADVLERIWAICALDKTPRIDILHAIAQVRLSSPKVNCWLATVLETITASTNWRVHDAANESIVFSLVYKLLKVPDPSGSYLASKIIAASCIVNSIQFTGESAASTIVSDGVLLPLLLELMDSKDSSAQEASMRVVWRICYHCPAIRQQLITGIAKVGADNSHTIVNDLYKKIHSLLGEQI